jgi:predicted nucleic acid-binding protein
MLIVADAGPILSFVRAGYFDLLRGVVGTLTIPEAVYAEIVVQGAGKLMRKTSGKLPGSDARR